MTHILLPRLAPTPPRIPTPIQVPEALPVASEAMEDGEAGVREAALELMRILEQDE